MGRSDACTRAAVPAAARARRCRRRRVSAHAHAPFHHAQVYIAVNGTVPGPTLIVDEGDWVVVTVTNLMGDGTTLHWHGMLQVSVAAPTPRRHAQRGATTPRPPRPARRRSRRRTTACLGSAGA